ncbi:Uncharacterised protein [Mycobacteroides abscessus subsp. abscessus]|nr:Uncharacterised protein [Mycobacteroides abscessus subsp. abscessus]
MMRDAVSVRSVSAVTASLRAAAAVGSDGAVSIAILTLSVESRTTVRYVASSSSSTSMRPGSMSWMADPSVAMAASRRSASSGSTNRAARRSATAMDVADSSPVATLVTRSTSSWASSTTSSWCSGRTLTSEMASMASNAWLVTMTSTAPALARAFSAKQSVP